MNDPDLTSFQNLQTFDMCVKYAALVPKAEEEVRSKLKGWAEICPIGLLQKIGVCIIEYRKQELRDQAQTN